MREVSGVLASNQHAVYTITLDGRTVPKKLLLSASLILQLVHLKYTWWDVLISGACLCASPSVSVGNPVLWAGRQSCRMGICWQLDLNIPPNDRNITLWWGSLPLDLLCPCHQELNHMWSNLKHSFPTWPFEKPGIPITARQRVEYAEGGRNLCGRPALISHICLFTRASKYHPPFCSSTSQRFPAYSSQVSSSCCSMQPGPDRAGLGLSGKRIDSGMLLFSR